MLRSQFGHLPSPDYIPDSANLDHVVSALSLWISVGNSFSKKLKWHQAVCFYHSSMYTTVILFGYHSEGRWFAQKKTWESHLLTYFWTSLYKVSLITESKYIFFQQKNVPNPSSFTCYWTSHPVLEVKVEFTWYNAIDHCKWVQCYWLFWTCSHVLKAMARKCLWKIQGQRSNDSRQRLSPGP